MKDIIRIEEKAKERLIKVCELHQKNAIKLIVTNKGCSGHSYNMDFVESNGIDPKDEKINLTENLIFVIDSKSVMFIIGTELAWTEDGLNSKFEFKNPKATSVCGCGESFSV